MDRLSCRQSSQIGTKVDAHSIRSHYRGDFKASTVMNECDVSVYEPRVVICYKLDRLNLSN